MEEKKIYQEIPGGRNKFHSALLTTYSFNFHHFEYQVLKTLKQKWIINVGVLADGDKLDEVLGISSGGLKQMTKSYSINGVRVKGAFHPKINFFIGDKQLLLVLGSGNLTPGGQGKNHETFSALYAENGESPLIPLFNEAYKYVQNLAKDISGFSGRRIERSIPVNCQLLGREVKDKHSYHGIDEQMELALLYNDESSILSQLNDLVPLSAVKHIRVLSPYYDQDGGLLKELAELCPNADLEVYIPTDNSLPPVNMEKHTRIKFLKWEETKRAKKELSSPESYGRKLHSKVFLFETEDESYFMVGSANATRAAFGSLDHRGVNEEFDLLYKTPKRDFFKELGISGKKTVVNPSDLKREEIVQSAAPEKKVSIKRKVEITSCDLDRTNLTVQLISADSLGNGILSVCSDFGDIIHEEEVQLKEELKLRLPLDSLQLNPAYVVLLDSKENPLSNKQVINFVDKLYDTDPSYENRTIRGVRNALEIGKINEFQLMQYLNIAGDREQEVTTTKAVGTRIEKEDQPDIHANLTYAEAMELSKNKDMESKLITQHNSVQFWHSLSSVFRQRYEAAQESVVDEEELGSAEKSHERQSEKEEVERVIHVKDSAESNRILGRSEHLAKQYVRAVESTLSDKELELNEVVYCQFLLVGHILTAVLQFNTYELPRNKQGKYTLYTPERWQEILQGKFHDIMQDVLVTFAKLCLTHRTVEAEDEFRDNYLQKYVDEVIANVILYHYFINRSSPENTLMDITDLACLTIFNRLGFPKEEVLDQLEVLAKSEAQELFDIRRVRQVLRRLQAKEALMNSKEGYLMHPVFGACKEYRRDAKEIYFKSIYNQDYFNRMKIVGLSKL